MSDSINVNHLATLARLKLDADATAHAEADLHNIIGMIDEIAFQTNLLALNAAIESYTVGKSSADWVSISRFSMARWDR